MEETFDMLREVVFIIDNKLFAAGLALDLWMGPAAFLGSI